jgi:periplasmic copper chaperone A
MNRVYLVTLLALAACKVAPAATPAATVVPHMRPAPQGQSSAVYFTLRNPAADTMVFYGVEIDVAASATIHRSMDHNNMSTMMPVDSIVVLPQDSVVFAERGLHIMATNLHTPIVIGDTVVVRLKIRPTRVDTLKVAVRE